ncbi:DUF6912 family protein [Calidifontibacter terrae]
MTTERIYLPLDDAALAALASDRQLPSPPLGAFAVTEAVRAAVGGDDVEVHEFAACQEAAAYAIGHGVLVVGAADLATAAVLADTGDAQVEIRGPLPLARFASFHLIDLAAYESEPDAEIELSWFDATELNLLRGLLSAH